MGSSYVWINTVFCLLCLILQNLFHWTKFYFTGAFSCLWLLFVISVNLLHFIELITFCHLSELASFHWTAVLKVQRSIALVFKHLWSLRCFTGSVKEKLWLCFGCLFRAERHLLRSKTHFAAFHFKLIRVILESISYIVSSSVCHFFNLSFVSYEGANTV